MFHVKQKGKAMINKRLERMLNELNTEKRIREIEKENERKMKEIEKIKKRKQAAAERKIKKEKNRYKKRNFKKIELKRKIDNEIKKYAAGTEKIEYIINNKVVTKEEFINYIANEKFKKKNKKY